MAFFRLFPALRININYHIVYLHVIPEEFKFSII